MNISSIGQNAAAVATPQGASSTQPARPLAAEREGRGEESQSVHHSHHGGGGRMHHALTSARQSLGLTLPATESADMKGGDDKQGSDRVAAGNGEQRRAAPSSVQQDMRRFMHALFQAVKAQAPSGPPDAAVNLPSVQVGEGRPLEMRDKFAAALSSLISQVGAGKAPAELQAAFIQLEDDLQPSKATGSTMMPTSSTTPNASAYMPANRPANTLLACPPPHRRPRPQGQLRASASQPSACNWC